MCVCAYSTLFQVKYLDYKLVPQHYTDEGSLLFIGAYLCRLTFPISYNFLKMVNDEDNSVFVKVSPKRLDSYVIKVPMTQGIIFIVKIASIVLRKGG